MADFIAYYRVSTDRQGASGLGLAAQREAVARFIGAGQLIAEYSEVESGKKHTNRPQLLAALADCRTRRAVLLIARLDRLARNVAFIANLMESGADFVAVDMPTANRLTIHILAAVAEHEREMISTRTKAALAEAKRRDMTLGNPRFEDARALAAASHHARRPAPEVLKLMTEWQQQGKGLRQIARDLNRLNIRPARGREWYATSVRNQLMRVPCIDPAQISRYGDHMHAPITRHHLKLLDAAEAIRLDPDKVEAAFMARQLVQATLPHKNPGDVPAWSCRNGNLTLTIRSGWDHERGAAIGYPYGTLLRLLLFWMITEAVRTKNRRLELGGSLASLIQPKHVGFLAPERCDAVWDLRV